MQMQLFTVSPFLTFSQFGKYVGSLIIAELYPFLKGEKEKERPETIKLFQQSETRVSFKIHIILEL